uniref:Uncharacterized protein n=1 Tax=Salix viminalis TaxID=40686 RepID=A0A6N2KUI6_SALVM
MVVRGSKKGKAGSVKRQDRDRGRQMSFSESQSSSQDCKRHDHSSSPKRHRNGAEEPKKKREKKDYGTDHPDLLSYICSCEEDNLFADQLMVKALDFFKQAIVVPFLDY